MKMKNNLLPLISTIIPVFNGGRYIAQAIESILEQGYPNTEIIVIDDGSTDNTAAVVKQFNAPVCYFYQENAGIAATMNHGVRRAKGDFFSFLDSDDYWLPGKTSKQLDLLRQNPELDMVFGHVKQFYSPELSQEYRQKYACPETPIPGYNSGSMLIRRSSFFKVGKLDEKYEKGMFNDWIMRAKTTGLRSMMLPDIIYMRRIHDANYGILKKDKYVDYVRALKAHLDRQRQGSKQ